MEQYKAKGVMYFTLHFESHTLPVKYIRAPKHHFLFGLHLVLITRFTMLITMTTHALELICLCYCLVLLLISYFITSENPCTYNPDDPK